MPTWGVNMGSDRRAKDHLYWVLAHDEAQWNFSYINIKMNPEMNQLELLGKCKVLCLTEKWKGGLNWLNWNVPQCSRQCANNRIWIYVSFWAPCICSCGLDCPVIIFWHQNDRVDGVFANQASYRCFFRLPRAGNSRERAEYHHSVCQTFFDTDLPTLLCVLLAWDAAVKFLRVWPSKLDNCHLVGFCWHFLIPLLWMFRKWVKRLLMVLGFNILLHSSLRLDSTSCSVLNYILT